MAGVMSAVRRDDWALGRGIGSPDPGVGRRGLASTRRAVDASHPLMDARAAADLLGVPSSWLLMAARDGRVPHHRIGTPVGLDPGDPFVAEGLVRNVDAPMIAFAAKRSPAFAGTPPPAA